MPIVRPSFRVLLHQLQHIVAVPLASPATISDVSGETWIGLGGADPMSIPPETALAQHEHWPVDDADEYQQTPESRRGPVWSSEHQEFLAYGIDLRGEAEELNESWVHSSFLNEDEYLDPSDRDKITPELARKIRRDLDVANNILATLDHRGGMLGGRVDRLYDAEVLLSAIGAAEVKRELRRARRVMDERCAAINLGILRSEDTTRTYIEHKFAGYIEKWKLLTRMRGIYIDFRHFDPYTIRVVEMLKHRVPVFYPLDPQFLPRFPAEEVQACEQVVTLEDYLHWFSLPEYWPDVDKSKSAPSIIHGLTADELAVRFQLKPDRLERLDDAAMHARFILADALTPEEEPVVNPLGSISTRIMGSALLLVEPLSELRMMYWAISFRSSNVGEVLGEALLRGWAFRVLYPEDYLEALAKGEFHPSRAMTSPTGLVIVLGSSEDLDPQIEWLRFLERVQVLLSRPHAKSFLLLGGIFWRLAILFGANYLQGWMEDVIGPSVDLVRYRAGKEVIPGYWSDEVTEHEMDVLIGLVYSKVSRKAHTWFPPHQLLIKYGFHNGDWSIDEERLVMDRYISLQNGETRYRPLSFEDWEEELCHYKVGKLARNSLVIPQSRRVDILLLGARAELNGSWDRADMNTITASLSLGLPSKLS